MKIKKIYKAIAICLILILLCACGNKTIYSKNVNISDSVNFSNSFEKCEFIPENDHRSNLLFNKLEITDMDNTKIKPTIAFDNALGLESIGDQAQREVKSGSAVIAGINCDMYAMEGHNDYITGIPMNATIIDGVIYNSAQNFGESCNLPVFAVRQDNTPFLGHIYISGNIKFTNANGIVREYTSGQFNRNYGLVGIGTFTRKISSDFTIRMANAADDSFYGVVKDAIVIYIISGIEDADNIRVGKTYTGKVEKIVRGQLEVEIPEGCIALADARGSVSSVGIGESVEVKYSVNEIDEKGKISVELNDIEQCVGAYNWIVKDGAVQTEDIYKEQGFPTIDYIINTPTARTAIGIKADNSIVMATADQSVNSEGYSAGLTMEEWGEYFASMGCVNAVNFDGGGSTEMIVINKEGDLETVNCPTDGESRKISTGLLLISSDGDYRGYNENNAPVIVGAAVTAGVCAIISVVVLVMRGRNKRQFG